VNLAAFEPSGMDLAFENGDANGDFALDISDGIHLLSYLYAGGASPVPYACGDLSSSFDNGDANGDGGIDLSDAIYLLSHLYLGGPRPVEIACGVEDGMGFGAGSTAVHRPLSDFLSTQGTFCQDVLGDGSCYLFVPPAPNFLGWTNDTDTNTDGVQDKPLLFAGVDFAGLANAHFGDPFGTEISGSILERPLADGRAAVDLLIHTRNANGWVIDLDVAGDVLAQIADKPTLFGQRPEEIDPGETPSLGSTSLRVVFINTAPGAPIPDITQLAFAPSEGQVLQTLAFAARLDGTLNAPFGVPDGTPGRCTIMQNGILTRGINDHLVAGDGFPAEFIELKQTGR
jgi:hypothetical protein